MANGPTDAQLAEYEAQYQAMVAAQSATPSPAVPQSADQMRNLPGMSNDQIGEMRAMLLKHGADPAEVDRALRLDGYVAPQPISEEARARAEYGLNPNPQPSDYTGWDMPRNLAGLPSERQSAVRSELGSLNAAMGLDPIIGNALSAEISRLGPELRSMPDADKAAWLRQQDKTLVNYLGSETAAKEARAKATKMLGKTDLGKQIAGSAVAASFWIICTLANYYDQATAFNSRRN